MNLIFCKHKKKLKKHKLHLIFAISPTKAKKHGFIIFLQAKEGQRPWLQFFASLKSSNDFNFLQSVKTTPKDELHFASCKSSQTIY